MSWCPWPSNQISTWNFFWVLFSLSHERARWGFEGYVHSGTDCFINVGEHSGMGWFINVGFWDVCVVG